MIVKLLWISFMFIVTIGIITFFILGWEPPVFFYEKTEIIFAPPPAEGKIL